MGTVKLLSAGCGHFGDMRVDQQEADGAYELSDLRLLRLARLLLLITTSQLTAATLLPRPAFPETYNNVI